VEYDVGLKETLTALGMGIAFDEGKANFSSMAKVSKEKNLYISQVKHKTFVEVNEEGTEAAASTQVEFRTRGPAPVPFKMEVNRPFLFVIQEEESQNVLFVGAIVNL
jgi:serpin B